MKSNRLFAAILAVAALLSASSAFAQPDPFAAPIFERKTAKVAPDLAPLDAANWRAIRVQNVPPSLIAYQLDMEHNKLPAFFNVPPSPQRQYAADFKGTKPDEKRAKGPFDLPDGVRLAASDEQNLLFIAGADEPQIAKLQELVSILDQPLRRVEIEAQIVELPVEEMKQFGIDFPAQKDGTPAIPGAFQVGFVRDNFQDILDKMVAAGTVKVLSTQPLTIINNTSRAVSLRSGPIDNTGANQSKPLVAPAEGSDTILNFTPTINGDETITVLMGIATLPNNINRSGLETIANVRDGDTIALGGLKSSLIPPMTKPLPLVGEIPLVSKPSNSKTDDRMTLMFVTARILRDDGK